MEYRSSYNLLIADKDNLPHILVPGQFEINIEYQSKKNESYKNKGNPERMNLNDIEEW